MAFGDGMIEGSMSAGTNRAVRLLARSLFKELKRAGYERGAMVAFACELLELVTHEMRADGTADGEDSAS